MRKILPIIITVLFISAVVISSVLAFGFGNVDGVWGQIDAGGVTVIDSIGDISSSSTWGSNITLRKVITVCTGDTNPDDTFTVAPNWVSYSAGTYTGLIGHTVSGCTPTDLIISEYVERTTSTTTNRAIEIYNGTANTIDLRKYSVVIYTNGSADTIYTEIIFLNGTIAPGAVHVVVNSNHTDLGSYYDQLSGVMTFNGDDAIVLRKGNEADATESNWASGSGDAATRVSGTYWNQTNWTGTNPGTYNTDENQVRYGNPQSGGGFAAQSGLGFDGRDGGITSLVPLLPFWLGRATHYNNPILRYIDGSITNGHYNNLVYVPLGVTVSGLVCGNGQPPNEGSTLTFTYGVTFEETPNESYCPYGDSGNGCDDRITVSANPPSTSFTCDDLDEPASTQGIWTIQLLGFQDHNSTDCATQTYNSSLQGYDFITTEQLDNHACLWAQVTEFVPTAATINNFSAKSSGEGILLTWETVNEVNTLGFNLYRANATAAEGEKELVNPELLPSAVAPGSLDGATYTYEDLEVENGVTYLYWLEEVDLDSKSTLYGPLTVLR